MKTEQLSSQLYSVILMLDDNRIYLARDVSKADAEEIRIELKKNVIGEIEIAPNECSPPAIR